MVQWLRLRTPNTGGTGSILVQGTKISHATQWGQINKQTIKILKKKKNWADVTQKFSRWWARTQEDNTIGNCREGMRGPRAPVAEAGLCVRWARAQERKKLTAMDLIIQASGKLEEQWELSEFLHSSFWLKALKSISKIKICPLGKSLWGAS